MRLRAVPVLLMALLISSIPAGLANAQAPVNSGAPQISGTTAVGETLTTTSGLWSFTPESFVYQWSRCSSQLLSSCNVIPGATSATYKLTESDGRYFILVSVTALNAGAGTTASSTFSTRILTKPVATAIPIISGSPMYGATLSLSLGTWSGIASGSFTYQWQRCSSVEVTTCRDLANATENSYLLQTADVGQYIRGSIKVLATNENLEGIAFTSLTSRVSSEPLSTSVPTIAGVVAVGERLTTSTGNFTAFPEPTYTYQWQKCNSVDVTSCVVIPGATNSDYLLSESQLASYIRVMVTASNSLGVRGTPSSLTSAVINPSLPVNQIVPSISGSPVDRLTLTLALGTWSGVPTPTTAAQWQLCTDAAGANCSDISGATNATLKLTFADLGKYFRAKVTATNRIGVVSANSNLLGPVVAATKLDRAPSTFGFLQVGQEWIATPGIWSGALAPTYSYQWQRCADEKGATCSDIAGATKKEYTIQGADKGFYIRVKNWIADQTLPAYSEILAVKIAAKPELPKAEATAEPSAKPAPAKRITITCVKGKTTQRVTAANPKCPTGFKKK